MTPWTPRTPRTPTTPTTVIGRPAATHGCQGGEGQVPASRSRGRVRAAHPERGSATVLAVGLVAGLAVLLVAALMVVSVLVAGQRARTAADLAALAGAGVVVQGGSVVAGCAAAAQLATRNGADLVTCTARDRAGHAWPALVVEVERRVGGTALVARAVGVAGGVGSTG